MDFVFVTTGTSAITNEHIGTVTKSDKSSLRPQVKLYLQDPTKKPERWTTLQNQLIQEHKSYWDQTKEYVESKRNFLRTSAELVSTVLFVRQMGLAPRCIVLISSDTEDCWMAAQVNAAVMAPLFPEAKVVAERIPDLTLDFNLLKGALETVVNKYHRNENDPAYINITGGFKGTVALMTLLALRGGWKLFYQHDTRDEPVLIDLKKI